MSAPIGPPMAYLIGLSSTALIITSTLWTALPALPPYIDGGVVIINKYTSTTDQSGATVIDVQYIKTLDVFSVIPSNDRAEYGSVVVLAIPNPDVPNGTYITYEFSMTPSSHYGVVFAPRAGCLAACASSCTFDGMCTLPE